jgi:hypothetical protein
LKEKYIDIEVLRIICDASEKNLVCADNEPIFKLQAKILKLFGRIVSIVSIILLSILNIP